MNFMRWLLRISLSFIDVFPTVMVIRFLLRVDQWLYFIQGQAAIRYGSGIHPKHRLMKYHDYFITRIQRNEHVLDIGCGNGTVAYYIAEKSGSSVTGIDINPKNIDEANKRNPHPRVQYVCGDILKGIPDGDFDVIVLSNILEHIKDRTGLLKNLQTKIQPSRMLIRVPLFERDWRVPLKKELGVEWRLDPTHKTEYTIESFGKEIEDSSLMIIHQEVRWGEIWAEIRSSKT